MNIDERPDRLIERHEVLTPTVEILLFSVRKTSDPVKRLTMIFESHERRLGGMHT